jgi:DNA repair exonuclease SbcCD ATPase subunit
MSLQDRFRIDELTKLGSKSITRDESGNILVSRINNKEINTEVKTEKPFGQVPIKDKQTSVKTKEDLANQPVEKNIEQTSFSGETSTYIELPRYNEEELKKAIDVKVDELVKTPKPPRGKFVPEDRYKNLQNQLNNRNSELRTEKQTSASNLSRALKAESQIQTLTSQVDGLNSQISELNSLLQENGVVITDQRIDIQEKTTDIFTLQADVARWQAQAESIKQQLETQTENLKAQLASQESLIDSLNNQNKTLQDQIKVQAEIFAGQLDQAQATLEISSAQFQAQLQAQSQQIQSQSQQVANLQKNQKKIICNELYRQGYLPQLLWDADERYGDMMFEKNPRLVIGYQMWARYVVKFMKENPQYTKYTYKFFKPWTEFMGYEMGIVKKQNLLGKLTNFIGTGLSYLVFELNNGERILDLYNYKKLQQGI